MKALSLELRPWPGRRLVALVALVLALQLALVFGLSDRRPYPVRQAAPVPALHLTGAVPEQWLALEDPTLFALPNERGFSGEAWMQPPPAPAVPFTWSEPPRLLAVPAQELALNFGPPPAAAEDGLPRLAQLPPPPGAAGPESARMLSGESRLRLGDGLAGRRLLTPVALPPQAYTDLLQPTTVQVVVDADGRNVSAKVIAPGSGLAVVDEFALAQARALRFEPLDAGTPTLEAPLGRLTWGELVFEWQTLPIPSTNAPAAPQP